MFIAPVRVRSLKRHRRDMLTSFDFENTRWPVPCHIYDVFIHNLALFYKHDTPMALFLDKSNSIYG
jgi:hypothetical protein